jgi:fibronectin-binding autotransporter adhesin
MKPRLNRFLAASISSVFTLSSSAFAADVTKADNSSNLDLGISWGGTAPTASDIALWNGTYNTSGGLSSGFTASTPVSWQGVRIDNITGTAAGLISIGGTGAAAAGSAITLGSAGIDMSAANQNAVINAATVVLGSSQRWDVGSGRNLRFGTTGTGAANSNIDGGSSVIVTVQGGGLVDLNQGSGINGLSGYAGKWIVGSGTTLRSTRSNAEAFGSNTAVDAITLSGGTLAVGGITGAQGNWSWNHNITLTSATNSTISGQNPDATARTLDLTGAIIGSGNLTFSRTQSSGHSFLLKNFGTTTGGVRTNIMGSGDVTINGVTLRLEPTGAGAGLSFTHNNNLKLVGGTLQSFDGIQTFAGTIALEGTNTISSNWSGKNVFLNGVIGNGGVAGSLTLIPGLSQNDNTITVNGNNTYTGGTTLGDNAANKGIVVAGHNNAFGTGDVNIRGAQLRAGSAGIILGNAISVGAGGLRLGGTNSFTLGGTTSIDAASRTIVNYGTATVTLGTINTVSGSVAAFDNAGTGGSGAQIIVNGNITGAGGVALSNNQNTAFNGANNYSGATTISGGNISGTGSITSSPVAMSGGSIMLAGGLTTTSLTFSGGVTFTGAPTVKFATNPVASTVYDVFTYGAGSVTGGNLLTAAWRGTMSDDTANQKFIFTAGASAARSWNITTGTWNNSGTNTNWLEGDQKFFDLDSVTFGNIASDSTITLSGNLTPAGVSVTNATNSYTFTGGAITGPTGLAKSGDGSLAIATQQSYTGGTTVNGGTLDLTGGGGVNGTIRGSITVTNNGTLKFSAGDVTGYGGGITSLNTINLVDSTLNVNTVSNQTLGSAVINMTGSSITGIAGSNIDLFANGSKINTLASATTSTISLPTMNLRQNNTEFSVANGAAAIDLLVSSKLGDGSAGSHNLIKNGAGTMQLIASNTATGSITINDGTLNIAAGGLYRDTGGIAAFNNTAVVTINAGGTLKLKSFSYDGDGGTGGLSDYDSRRVLNGGILEVVGTTQSSGNNFTVTANGGMFRYNPALPSDTLTLSGNGNSDISVAGTTTFDTVGNVTVNEVVSGAGGITKTGAQTLTLTETNTYTGATYVSEGTLIIVGNISTSVLTTVASGTAISGDGTTGALTVLSGAEVNPGNSPGILTTTGNFNLAGTYNAELDGTTVGSGYDQIDVTGTVTLSGLLNLISSFTATNDDLFFLIKNDGTDGISGTFSGLADGSSFFAGTQEYKISYFGNAEGTPSFTGGNDVALMAIPEPSAALLSGLGLLALLRRRRP